jgi:hypothetical protein
LQCGNSPSAKTRPKSQLQCSMTPLQYDNTYLHNLGKALTAMKYDTFCSRLGALTVRHTRQCSIIAPYAFAVKHLSSLPVRMTIYGGPAGSCNGFTTSDSPFDFRSTPKLPSRVRRRIVILVSDSGCLSLVQSSKSESPVLVPSTTVELPCEAR